MKRVSWRCLGAWTAAAFVAAAAAARAADGQYYFIREIPIGGPAGAPSLAIDPAARRLYLAHSTRLEVVDLESNLVVGSVSNLPAVRALAVAPWANRLVVDNYRNGPLSILELPSLQVVSQTKNLAWSGPLCFPAGQTVLEIFDTRSPSVGFFDVSTVSFETTIPLPGKPQAAIEGPDGKVFVALFDRNQVEALDAKGQKLGAVWPVSPGREPAALAMDDSSNGLLVACRNKLLVRLDCHTGKVTGSMAIGAGVDAAAYDPTNKLIFCANSDGTTTITRADASGKLSLVQTLQTERNARVMALDVKTHQIYLATTDFEAQNVPDEDAPPAPTTRPRTLANTLKLLVYGPAQP